MNKNTKYEYRPDSLSSCGMPAKSEKSTNNQNYNFDKISPNLFPIRASYGIKTLRKRGTG